MSGLWGVFEILKRGRIYPRVARFASGAPGPTYTRDRWTSVAMEMGSSGAGRATSAERRGIEGIQYLYVTIFCFDVTDCAVT